MQTQNEIRQSITNRLVDALKNGTNIPWRRPWKTNGPRLPTNFVAKRPYSGINVLTLWLASQERNFPVDYWATFNQWKSIGANIKKGEKGERIVFYSQVKKTVTDAEGKDRLESFPILKTWSVFNIAQVQGEVVEAFQEQSSGTKFDVPDREEFDRVVAATDAEITFGGDRACYHRFPDDFIQMPFEEAFVSFPAFAETILHELAHWTEFRLDWTGTYAEGELRAEIAACFLTAELGIPNSDDLSNHAKYLASWLQALENDPKFIFRASSAANKAAEFIMSFSRPQESENNFELEVVTA